MEHLIPVLMVVGMVAFILIKQIGKITTKLDTFSKEDSHNRYAQFSSVIQEHVRAIKNSLDSTKMVEERPYLLREGKEETEALEILSDYIRKLVFFETLMAKQKNAQEIEAELFEILNGLENFLKTYCVDGETLSETLRDRLLEAYETL
ncbi:hypothetical protein [Sulfurospirillum deleyianum]|uniref:Uncharacterized protein n=1 Tax=Sulfurospirillum deleyianum (strain ATCC 51133 / DSM 6946 / 5175) TaxID=525898 RepID=D1B2L7_SULD5|nr:hypothetical protein [Sulfurospirillum deleyianum]ACZ12337.1 hypothetical protein Sdel_1317 [Sulfurospirillum deleyianum DSM 6946]